MRFTLATHQSSVPWFTRSTSLSTPRQKMLMRLSPASPGGKSFAKYNSFSINTRDGGTSNWMQIQLSKDIVRMQKCVELTEVIRRICDMKMH